MVQLDEKGGERRWKKRRRIEREEGDGENKKLESQQITQKIEFLSFPVLWMLLVFRWADGFSLKFTFPNTQSELLRGRKQS